MHKILMIAIGFISSFISWHVMAMHSHSQNTTRIINGQFAPISQFPSFASLFFDQLESTGLYQNYCGATILDEYHVLTAAHCVEGDSYYSTFTSIAPKLELESQVFSGAVPLIRASEFYYPSTYINSALLSWPDDIAIIKLESPMPVSNADFVTLATAGDIPTYNNSGTIMTVLGHGYDAPGIDSIKYLQSTTQTLLSSNECSDAYTSDKQLCTQGAIDSDSLLRNSTCGGDSGGPLFWEKNGEFVQVGITSYGPSKCGDPNANYASAYTEVAEYRDWITSVLEGKEIPKIVVTDFDRENFVSENDAPQVESSSGGSGGALSIWWILLMFGIGQFNKKRV
jgi:secreted trypsin-like serine protease